jgi:hypothetical protein
MPVPHGRRRRRAERKMMERCKRHRWDGGEVCLRCGTTKEREIKRKADEALQGLLKNPSADCSTFFEEQAQAGEEE